MPYEPPQYDPTAQLRTLFALLEMQQREKLQQQSLAANAQDSLLKFAGAGIDPGAVSQIGSSLGASPQAMQAATTLSDQVRLQRSREAALDPRMLAQQAGQVAPSVGPGGNLTVSPEQQSSFASSVAQIQADDPRMRAERLNALGSYVQAQSADAQQRLGAQKFATQEQRKTQAIGHGMQVSENKRQEARASAESSLAPLAMNLAQIRASKGDDMTLKQHASALGVSKYDFERVSAMADGINAEIGLGLRGSPSTDATLSKAQAVRSAWAERGHTLSNHEAMMVATDKWSIGSDGTVITAPPTSQRLSSYESSIQLESQIGVLESAMADVMASGEALQPPFMVNMMQKVGQSLPPASAGYVSLMAPIVSSVISMYQSSQRISDQDMERFSLSIPQLYEMQGDGAAARAKLKTMHEIIAVMKAKYEGGGGAQPSAAEQQRRADKASHLFMYDRKGQPSWKAAGEGSPAAAESGAKSGAAGFDAGSYLNRTTRTGRGEK